MTTLKKSNNKIPVIFRLSVCLLLLGGGITGMQLLATMKKPPTEAIIKEQPIQVATTTARSKKVEVVLHGYGEISSFQTVTFSAEVNGRIEAIHSRLEPGEIINQNDSLFNIDPSEYQAAVLEAEATVKQLQNHIQLLAKQLSIDENRLKTIKRNRNLAKSEFNRHQQLYKTGALASRSEIDRKEQAFNAAEDVTAITAKAIALYPLQIEDTQQRLAAAKARLQTAIIRLNRCTVKAPFSGRVKKVSVEAGQYAMAGQALVSLVNDSALEIHVPLDSRESKQWLRFTNKSTRKNWFNELEPVPCLIQWVEDKTISSVGYLHRVVNFNPKNRSLIIAVRLNPLKPSQTEKQEGTVILSEGMFCSLSIPGKTMFDVFQLPNWAVSFQNTVYLAVNNRLKTQIVEIVRRSGDKTFISAGLKDGDQVITTRLVAPLENALLKITNAPTPLPGG